MDLLASKQSVFNSDESLKYRLFIGNQKEWKHKKNSHQMMKWRMLLLYVQFVVTFVWCIFFERVFCPFRRKYFSCCCCFFFAHPKNAIINAGNAKNIFHFIIAYNFRLVSITESQNNKLAVVPNRKSRFHFLFGSVHIFSLM